MTISYLDRVRFALDRVGGRLADLVTSAPDLTARVRATPEWTVMQAAEHVVTVVGRYADGPEGRATWVADPGELPGLNQAQIDALPAMSASDLAGRLRRDLAAVCAQIEGYGERVPTYRFHGGAPIAADTALGVLLGELVVHGWDIASTIGRPWPIDPGHVRLVMDGVNAVLPGWVDPDRARGLTATVDIRLRGQGATIWSFEDGRLTVDSEDHQPVDVRVSAHPFALLLVLYRRQTPWRHIATGRLIAWGRRPWLALTLADRFHKP